MNYFLKLAQEKLLKEISELNVQDDVKNLILEIEDPKLKGQAFSLVKKDNNIQANSLKDFINTFLAKKVEIENLKLRELQGEWLKLHDSAQDPKIKHYLKFLAKNKKLPEFKQEYIQGLKTIEHYISEKIKDADLTVFLFEDLYDKAIKWEETFKESEKNLYEKTDIVYGKEWKNKDFNGFYIAEITTENDLKLEGSLLHHCVGGYYDKLQNNESKIFSLRHPSNKPLVTIEVSPDLFHFKQTFGYSNAQPTSVEMSMINEWKQSLHPEEKILELASSDDVNKKISAAQFMDYSNPNYAKIIDHMIETEVSSGIEFVGSDTENSSKDALQALAANETLPEILYEKIYKKCSSNKSTIFNLVRNAKIFNNLFQKIYNNHKIDDFIVNTISSSFAIGRIENKEVLSDVLTNKLDNKNILLKILNNPSIKSSVIKSILSDFNEEQISKVFKDENKMANFEPKLIDDLLESNNKYLEKYYFDILLTNKNLNEKLLSKFSKKYGILNKSLKRENVIKNILEKNPNEIFKNDSFAKVHSKNPNLSYEQINLLLSKNNYYINENLAQKVNLSNEQMDLLLSKNNNEINRYLSKNSNLSNEQKNILFGKNDIIINRNLAQSSNLSDEQINFLLGNNDDYINRNLSQSSNLSNEQINLLLSKNNDRLNENLADNPNLSNEQINILLSKKNNLINYSLASNSNLSNEQIDLLLSKNNNINSSLAKNNILSSEQINLLLGKNDIIINRNLAQNSNLSNEQINFLLSQNDGDINHNLAHNSSLAKNNILSNEQIDLLLSKNNKYINGGLASNQNLSNEQIDLLFDKNDDRLNESLCRNSNLSNEQIDLLLSKNNENINYALAQNSNLSNEQIDLLLSKNNNINSSLAKNNILSNEQMNFLLSKNNNNINNILSKNPNLPYDLCIKLIKHKPAALIKHLNNNKKQASQSPSLILKLSSNYYNLAKALLN